MTEHRRLRQIEHSQYIRKPIPSQNQPGTLAEQFLAIALSLRLGQQNGTSAARQWNRATALAKGAAGRK